MAEISLIPPSADMMPAASGMPVAPVIGVSEGGFAGMLAQRLQPQAEEARAARTVEVHPSTVASGSAGEVVNMAETQGQASPQTGKPLPTNATLNGPPADELEVPMPTLSVLGDAATLAHNGDAALVPLSLGGLGEATPGLLSASATMNSDVAAFNNVDKTTTIVDLSADVAALQTTELAATLPGGSEIIDVTGQRVPQDRVLSQTALQLAKMENEQAQSSRTPLPQLAASLGLNANGETGGPLKSPAAALPVEQMMRSGMSGMAEQVTNQVLAGDSLSRQFQQQIDRMLASSRGSGSAGASVNSILAKSAVDSLAGSSPDTALNAVLPGIDVRSNTLTGALSGVTVPVSTSVGQPGWSADLGQRMVWLANQEVREAQIQLNPRHLGPIDVRIVYSDAQQLSVSFNAQNPAAREALDAALPRLREMFEQQGLGLADANVFDGKASQEFFSEQRQNPENPDRATDDGLASASDVSDDDLLPVRDPTVPIGLGMLDTFA